MSSGRSPIVGSTVTHLAGAARQGPMDGRRHLQATIVLRPQNEDASRVAADTHGLRRAAYGAHPAALRRLSRSELADLYDPGEDRFELVRAFARAYDLSVVETSRARHDVVVSGSVRALNRAFGVTLHHFAHDHGRYRAHEGPIQLTRELADVVQGVLGLDDVPVHSPHTMVGATRHVVTPAQLASHYAFPVIEASASRIALVEFGGGFHAEDLAAYAQTVGVRLPSITVVPVGGADGKAGQNAPLDMDRTRAIAAAWKDDTPFAELLKNFGADVEAFMETMEVTMDLQLTAALGGGAAVDVYFAPQGKDGWRRVLYAAIGEPVGGATAKQPDLPAVISASWGGSETTFGPMALGLVHDALVAVEHRGVLVCCSSGDRGASNEFSASSESAGSNVNFPASSPAVLACGGSSLISRQSPPGFEERAWRESLLGYPMASGGGMSGYFARPPHQSAIDVTPLENTWRADGVGADFVGRWVPDIAANASFDAGVLLVVGGEQLTAGGTSAATPLCAALLTRVGAVVGHPLAGLTPWLYTHGGSCCHDIVSGDDDIGTGKDHDYRAGPGWDACTGLGTPDGQMLGSALKSSAPHA